MKKKSKFANLFVLVPGITIDGNETWTPESSVFIPERSIKIRDLLVCDHQVTRGEYKKIIGNDPSEASTPYDEYADELKETEVLNNPVTNVSWYDALVYCNKRSMAEGLTPAYKLDGQTDPKNWTDIVSDSEKYCGPSYSNKQWDLIKMDIEANGYRLPTEAEWEYLARGDEDYEYAGSDDITEVAWYRGNSESKTHEVKKKSPNKLNLYDMSGNVWEWCWDWRGNITESTDEMGATTGFSRCRRGGCWDYDDTLCAVALRNSYYPYGRVDSGGFRVVRTAK